MTAERSLTGWRGGAKKGSGLLGPHRLSSEARPWQGTFSRSSWVWVVTDFSVLLPVYRGDVPANFRRALQSVGADQSLKPSQIVVVCDGPVHDEVEGMLSSALAGSTALTGGARLDVIRIPRNGGLGPALNLGLRACRHDIVARADADDISLPQRFAVQVPLLEEGFDIVGSAIAEFANDEHRTGIVRRMPSTPEEIRSTIGFRDPFNHPTVVYRASGVRAVNGYEDVPHMEDYWLFSRMVAAGQRGTNLAEPLVLYRVGAGAYERRGGVTMLRSEIDLQRRLRRYGMTSRWMFLRNVLVRGGYRIVPTSLRRWSYRMVGRRTWFGQ